MPNKNYLKGVRKERRIVNAARALDLISFRSAASHSPVDVVVIDPKTKRMRLIQCKPDSMSEAAKMRIYMSCSNLSGLYDVEFSVE